MGVFCNLRQLRLLRECTEDGHGDALFPSTARASDTVDIILVFLRHVVVDNAIHIINVNAARGDVRRNQDGQLALLEGAHGLLALLLRNIAVDAVSLKSHADQIVAQTLAHDLRIAEDDGAFQPERADEPACHFNFFERRAGDGILCNVRAVVRVSGDGNLHLVALVHPRDGHNLLRDGRGEQAEIAAVLDLFDDLRHIVKETHVEHAVCLVQHNGLYLVKRERAALIMVHQPPRRGHDDLRMVFQLLDLSLNLRAAIDHGHADILIISKQSAQFVADLNGEFARRSENQPLQIFAFRVDMLDHGNAEGERLARAGRSLGDNVFPFHKFRDSLGLDAGRVSVALLFQRLQNLFRQAKVGKRQILFHRDLFLIQSSGENRNFFNHITLLQYFQSPSRKKAPAFFACFRLGCAV